MGLIRDLLLDPGSPSYMLAFKIQDVGEMMEKIDPIPVVPLLDGIDVLFEGVEKSSLSNCHRTSPPLEPLPGRSGKSNPSFI